MWCPRLPKGLPPMLLLKLSSHKSTSPQKKDNTAALAEHRRTLMNAINKDAYNGVDFV